MWYLQTIITHNSISYPFFNLQVSAFLVKNSMDSGDEINADSDEHKKVMLSIFEHEDKNGDGVISIEEFSGPKHDEL